MFSVCGAGLEDFFKAHGLRSMGLGAVRFKRPTQRSGWAWKMEVGGLICFLFVGRGWKIFLKPSAPNTPGGNTLNE